MPGAGFKRHALKVREIVKEASNKPYQETKAAVVNDFNTMKPPPSY